jgi:NAD(P)H-hydrate epimerase
MKVSRVSEMRALDRRAIEEYGIVEEFLMENAGQAVYFVILREFGVQGRKFVVFCGLGNNGGDGFVVARKLHSSGGAVQVFILGDPGHYKGAARTNLDIVSRLPIDVRRIESVEEAGGAVADCDAIVDAIFGTGLSREVGGLYRDAIERINWSGKTVFSVDIPSGVHGDTGQVMGTAVRADYTVTFGLPKVGNLFYPGYELGGKLYVSHISFPPQMVDADALKIEISRPLPLPPRDPNGHKGSFGDVLFVAGAASYLGAPYFSAHSFMKAGGGYSRLAAPASITPFIATKGSEIVFAPQQETEAGSIALRNKGTLLDLVEQVDMVVLGPGLSLVEETQQLARELAREVERPLLVDGDGITALCRDLDIVRHRHAPTILTPHLGEMSRITGVSIPEIATHKADVLQRTAGDLRAIVVLKGAHSLIGYPDGRVFINVSGNSGMATAGSGDVLTGTIAAMFGLGLLVPEAVRKGVFIHGLSGDLAAEAKGEDGITAQDILDYLPLAVRVDREGLPERLRERYVGARVV